MRMERCDAGEAMRLMKQMISGTPTFSFHGNSNPVPPHRESVITIEQIRPLENPALLAYLTERAIDLDTARGHCSEVHYRVADKSYFAVGFRNDAEDWELRNRYFKGCTSKAPTTRRGDYPTCLVFEGFMDYLSYLTLKHDPNPPYNIAVLNSVTNLAKAAPFIASHERVYTYLDNDEAGRKATAGVESRLPQLIRPIRSLPTAQRFERLPAQPLSRERAQAVARSQVVTSPTHRPLQARGFSSTEKP